MQSAALSLPFQNVVLNFHIYIYMCAGGMSKTDIALITISGVVTPVLPLILIGFIVKKIRGIRCTVLAGVWRY